MKGRIKYSLLVVLVLVSTLGTLHAQTDTIPTEKRLIDELTTQPKFVGDLNEYLAKNIRYPAPARENAITGRVIVRFLIDENGRVSDASLVGKRRWGGGLEQEALRIVKAMPAWQPATYKGKAVRVVYTLPIRFRLE